MNRYRIHATVTKTYVAEDDYVVFEIEADSEDEAKKMARQEADNYTDLSSCDADHDDTSVYIQQIDLVETERPDQDKAIPRCEKTIDMFQGA